MKNLSFIYRRGSLFPVQETSSHNTLIKSVIFLFVNFPHSVECPRSSTSQSSFWPRKPTEIHGSISLECLQKELHEFVFRLSSIHIPYVTIDCRMTWRVLLVNRLHSFSAFYPLCAGHFSILVTSNNYNSSWETVCNSCTQSERPLEPRRRLSSFYHMFYLFLSLSTCKIIFVQLSTIPLHLHDIGIT